jgi:hypothetical protein
MSEVWKKLASVNHQVLHKSAAGGYLIEVIDKDFVPMVKITGKDGKTSEILLEKLGLTYADEAQKFVSDDTLEVVGNDELQDLAIEAHLNAISGK